MSEFEVVLLGVALAMDAVAVSLTDGMAEPKMRIAKVFLIALFCGVFQGVMPLLGYFGGSALSSIVEKIAPWLSCGLLVFLGGRMVYESATECDCSLKSLASGRALCAEKVLTLPTLTAQAVATSIDALAVGVSLLAQETTGALPFSAPFCTLIIGVVTFLLSFVAVNIGKTAGNKFADKAETAGGMILIFIGIKLLLDGIC